MNAFRDFVDMTLGRSRERPSGVVLGRRRGRAIIDKGFGPTCVLGPCRSGKGTSVLTPTLLTWRGSAVVIEPLGELHTLTREWRSQCAKNSVRHWALADAQSPDGFNLLDGIRQGTPHEIRDVTALAEELVPSDEHTDHLTGPARALLAICIVSVLQCEDAHMGTIVQRLVGTDDWRTAVFQRRRYVDDTARMIWADALAADLVKLPDEELEAIRWVVLQGLAVFEDPAVKHSTARSTFKLADLRQGADDTTVYVTVRPWESGRTRGIVSAFLRFLTMHAMECAAGKRPLLVVLDEFTELGRLGFLQNAMPRLAECRVKLLLAIQSLETLRMVYGREDKVWHRCTTKAILGLRDRRDAADVAAELGCVGELQALLGSGKENAFVVRAGQPPICASTLPYYEDAGYKAATALLTVGGGT